MTTQRDPNAIIAAWLEEGPVDLPGTTRRAIATSLPTTTQRRGLGLPWRLPEMSTSLRLMLMAGALALAVGGIYLFSGVGSPPVAPAPSVIPGSVAPPSLPATPTVTSFSSPGTAQLGLTGRIVFNRYDTKMGMYGKNLGLFTANADGSGERRLDVPDTDGAAISPDGTKLLLSNPFVNDKFRPAVANIDGTGLHRLDVPGRFVGMWCGGWSPDATRVLCKVDPDQSSMAPGIFTLSVTDMSDFRHIVGDGPPGAKGSISQCGGGDVSGGYSPDGTQVVFMRTWCGTGDDPVHDQQAAIYVVDAAGETEPREIVRRGLVNGSEGVPQFSPDGTRILFGIVDQDIGMIHPDGTGYERIRIHDMPHNYYAYSPTWSPDGQWIMFTMWASDLDRSDLYVMRPDGTELTKVVDGEGTEDWASWGVAAP